MSKLRELLQRHLTLTGMSVRTLSDRLGMNYPTVIALINKGHVPRKPDHREAVRRELGLERERWAGLLAEATGAKIVVLKVVPRYPLSYFEGGMAIQPEEMKRVEKQWSDKGQSVVDAVKAAATEKGVQTQALTLTSDVVSDALINAATKHQCDLIVMASHGRRGIQRLLLGSETQHVLTHANIPVLVLK